MTNFAKTALALLITAMPLAASAQSMSVETFDALPQLRAEDLTALISGKSFEGKFPNGLTVEMEYKANGWALIRMRNAMGSDSGSRKWRVDGSSICIEGGGEKACNAAREDSTGLLVKSDTGAIVRYVQK